MLILKVNHQKTKMNTFKKIVGWIFVCMGLIFYIVAFISYITPTQSPNNFLDSGQGWALSLLILGSFPLLLGGLAIWEASKQQK